MTFSKIILYFSNFKLVPSNSLEPEYSVSATCAATFDTLFSAIPQVEGF
jgi:hypothetical protein